LRVSVIHWAAKVGVQPCVRSRAREGIHPYQTCARTHIRLARGYVREKGVEHGSDKSDVRQCARKRLWGGLKLGPGKLSPHAMQATGCKEVARRPTIRLADCSSPWW
jgi:hypothetical protein